jgi:hypothetical protein
MPAKYVRPYSKGQKNDFRDAEAIAEAVQRPTMKFVATKTTDQLDLQALHRVRERLVSQRTGIINQIRAFLLERGIAVRQGQRFLRAGLPTILATPPDVLSPRMVRIIEGLASDWIAPCPNRGCPELTAEGRRGPIRSLTRSRTAILDLAIGARTLMPPSRTSRWQTTTLFRLAQFRCKRACRIH